MKSIGTQILQTERLILRRFVESDAEAMFQNWASSAENLTYVTWDPHPDVEITRNSIRNWVASYTNTKRENLLKFLDIAISHN